MPRNVDFAQLTIPASGNAGPISKSIGFAIRSLAIDNYTNQWLYVRGADHYIEPYLGDAMLPMDGGQVLDIIVASPPGFPQAALNAGEVAKFIVFPDLLPFNPGASVASFLPAGAGRWTLVGGAKTLAAGVDSLTTGVVPPSTKTLAIVVSGSTTPAATFVQGVATGVIYLRAIGNATNIGMQFVSVDAAADTTYTINWNVGNSSIVRVYATDIVIPTATSQGQQLSAQSFPVVIASDQPAVTFVPANFFVYGQLKYDGQGTNNPAAGTRATVTLAANATQRWVAAGYGGAMAQISGAATVQNLNLIDGASGGGAVLDVGKAALTATANTAVEVPPRTMRAFANAVINTAMTLEWGANVAGVTQTIHLGAYLQ